MQKISNHPLDTGAKQTTALSSNSYIRLQIKIIKLMPYWYWFLTWHLNVLHWIISLGILLLGTSNDKGKN